MTNVEVFTAVANPDPIGHAVVQQIDDYVVPVVVLDRQDDRPRRLRRGFTGGGPVSGTGSGEAPDKESGSNPG